MRHQQPLFFLLLLLNLWHLTHFATATTTCSLLRNCEFDEPISGCVPNDEISSTHSYFQSCQDASWLSRTYRNSRNPVYPTISDGFLRLRDPGYGGSGSHSITFAAVSTNDLTDRSELLVRFKVQSASLSGAGWGGGEAPVVFSLYVNDSSSFTNGPVESHQSYLFNYYGSSSEPTGFEFEIVPRDTMVERSLPLPPYDRDQYLFVRVRTNGWETAGSVDFVDISHPASKTDDEECPELRVVINPDDYPEDISFTVAAIEHPSVAIATGTSSTTVKICTHGEYVFTIFDSYGDGLCCRAGDGSYELFLDGKSLGGGSRFRDIMSHEFIVGSPVSATLGVSITPDRYPRETSWKVLNAAGVTVLSGTDDSGTAELLWEEGPFTFTISDSYGDGICCRYGNGAYSLSLDGEVVAEGGEFGSSETVTLMDGGVTATRRLEQAPDLPAFKAPASVGLRGRP